MSVYGSGFVPGATLVWNGTALSTSFDTSMQLTAYVSMSWLEYAGTATVEVVNPTPGGGTSAPLTINILPPIITALSPSNIPQMSTTSTGVNVTITGQYFHSGTVVHADGFALPTTYLGPTSLMVLVDASILGTQRRGAVAIAVENGHFAMSNAMALTVGGTAGNAGTVSRHPLAPYPGEPYSAYLEGGAPNRPLVLLADLSNPTPVTSWPDPSANMILSVRDQPGTNWFVLADGIGIFQMPDGSSCNANGVFELGGFVLPTTPLGIDMTVQGAYIDPSSPVGFRLTWARFPDRL